MADGDRSAVPLNSRCSRKWTHRRDPRPRRATRCPPRIRCTPTGRPPSARWPGTDPMARFSVRIRTPPLPPVIPARCGSVTAGRPGRRMRWASPSEDVARSNVGGDPPAASATPTGAIGGLGDARPQVTGTPAPVRPRMPPRSEAAPAGEQRTGRSDGFDRDDRPGSALVRPAVIGRARRCRTARCDRCDRCPTMLHPAESRRPGRARPSPCGFDVVHPHLDWLSQLEHVLDPFRPRLPWRSSRCEAGRPDREGCDEAPTLGDVDHLAPGRWHPLRPAAGRGS